MKYATAALLLAASVDATHLPLGNNQELNHAVSEHIYDPAFQQAVQAELVKSIPSDADKQQMAQFLQGFFEAYGFPINIGNLLICIQEADAAGLDLYESSMLIKEAWESHGFMNIITPLFGGVVFGFLGIEAFMSQALPKCEAIINSEHQFDKIT